MAGTFLWLSVSLAAAADEIPLLAPGVDPARGWSFAPGAEFPGAAGSLEIDRDGVLHLRYDFSGGGAYVAAYRRLDEAAPLRALRFEARKPADATLTVRATDATGQTFQKNVHYGHDGWQSLEATMAGWTVHWGGANDGVFHPPVTQIGILINKDTAQAVGELTVRKVVALRGEMAPAEDRFEGTYRVTDFGPQSGFSGPLSDRWLKGDLTERGEVALWHSLALFGSPRELQLRVRGGTPGCHLALRLGSHFQSFTRRVGALDGGEQVFTVPAPPEGWSFSGGENDGRVHLPLRLVSVVLERGEHRGPAEVELLELRCVTSVSAANAITLLARIEDQGVEHGRRRLRAVCRGWNLQDRPVTGVLSAGLSNWREETLARSESEWTLPADGVPAESEVFFDVDPSANFAEVTFELAVVGAAPRRARAGFARAADDPGDSTLLPASPWGMGVYLYRYPGDPAGLERMDRAAALAQAAGVKWSREEFQWHRIEPRPGQFEWTFYDAMVETALRHGISVYGLLAYWAPWTQSYTEAGIDDYCRWARAVVRRYKDRIKHWEIYNEPNIFFWSGPKELYPVMLARAYAAIKEEDPEAQVLGISTAGIDGGFIQKVVDAGAPFDILTVHPYRGQLHESGFIAELRGAAEKVGGRPVWITEMGWSTQVGGTDERSQAKLLARCYLAAVASGVCGNVSWYDFRNDGADPFYNEHNFGVLRADLTPKPAYRALMTVCRSLAAPGAAPEPAAWPGLWSLRAGDALALWADRSTTLRCRVGSGRPRVLDLMGDELVAAAAGEVELSLRPGDPVFVVDGRLELLSQQAAESPDAPELIRF